MHLAELNVGRLRAPTDSPVVAEFMDALDEINALADVAPGFVWRLVDEDANDATSIQLDTADPLFIVNLSTWRSVADLRAYVYGSLHKAYLARRREWFEAMGEAVLVLWWVADGHRPTPEEALERLQHLKDHGPTAHAFTFRAPFPAPDAAPASAELR